VTAPVSAGTLSGTQNICIGDSVTFSSSVLGGSWTSSNPAVATINAATGAIVGVSAGSATMTYTVAGSGGCPNATATRTTTVTAPISAGTLSGTQNICIGDSVTFGSTVLGGTWTSSNTAVATINATSGAIVGVSAGSATMTYTVAGSGGCPNATATRTITVTAPVVAGTLSGTQNICIGDSVTFGSTVLGGSWTSSNPSVATIIAATGAIVGVSAGSATMTYTVAGSGGCPNAIATKTMTVKPSPQILNPSTYQICTGENITINLSANIPGTTFTWLVTQNNVSGANIGSGNTISATLTSNNGNAGSVVYGVIPMANGCEGNPFYITVRVWPLPKPQLNDGFVCLNILTNQAVQSHLLQTGLDNSNYTFDWYFNGTSISGANSNTYAAEQAGTYSVVATNINTNCVSEEVFATVTSSYIANSFVAEPSEAFADAPYIIVHTPAGTGPFLYQLDFGPFQNSNTFYNVSSGLHTIRVKDELGCTDLLGQVWILNYPKFFTPNNDSYNDTWNIPDLANQQDAHIYLFDRYAKFIKEISPQGEGWDGTHNGYPLPSTDYWFSVDYTDPNTFVRRNFKAHFSLKR
ncbi:MAG: T9SS type B sorting domain-containing protein, partial [Bacteroidetes bacterium]|nr:T9SS type B sorting domain-containing protein [Bacteroidota bacterium]